MSIFNFHVKRISRVSTKYSGQSISKLHIFPKWIVFDEILWQHCLSSSPDVSIVKLNSVENVISYQLTIIDSYDASSKIEIRAVVGFLWLNNCKPVLKIHSEACCKKVISRLGQSNSERYDTFKNGRTDITDEYHEGRPSTSTTTTDNIERENEINRIDRRQQLKEFRREVLLLSRLLSAVLDEYPVKNKLAEERTQPLRKIPKIPIHM